MFLPELKFIWENGCLLFFDKHSAEWQEMSREKGIAHNFWELK